VAATFNLAGVNPVDRTYSLGFAGKAKIKRTDFGVSAYAPALGDEVTLELEAELKMIG
jgi:polyisoprenoid-binding protein YceI